MIIYKTRNKKYKLTKERATEIAKYLYGEHNINEINKKFEGIKFKRKDLI